MPEFNVIDAIVSRIRRNALEFPFSCVLDIGDDAAVIEVPEGFQLVISTDTLNEGVHFPVGTPANAIGHKSLAVNLSDLAAMGARPGWYFLAISLPEQDDEWIAEFAEGQATLAARMGVCLAGGDTTRGPMSVTITAVGLVEQAAFMTRSSARAGDQVVVSGFPGQAAAALQQLKAEQQPDAEQLRALQYPEPRVALGRLIRHHATACIDVSDGLLADLGHILERSNVGAVVHLDGLTAGTGTPIDATLSGGDDYELCFCLPAEKLDQLTEWSAELNIPLTVVGEIREEPGLVIRDKRGIDRSPGRMGYQHFSGKNGGDPNSE